jgi:hypothetical protein
MDRFPFTEAQALRTPHHTKGVEISAYRMILSAFAPFIAVRRTKQVVQCYLVVAFSGERTGVFR